MNHYPRSNSSSGFTLIEFVVAGTILIAGLLGLAALLGTGIRSNALGGNTSQAVALAQEKLEQLRNLPASNSARANGGSVTSNVTQYYDTIGIFTRRWILQTGPAGTQICTVRVLGTTQDAQTRKQVEFSTIIR